VVYSHVAQRWKDQIKKATINYAVAVSQDIVLAWAVRKDSSKLREQLTAFFKSDRANPGR
jgi:predicted lipid-binding transport protein (Tim44 family)